MGLLVVLSTHRSDFYVAFNTHVTGHVFAGPKACVDSPDLGNVSMARMKGTRSGKPDI